MASDAPTLAQLIDPRTREGELWEPLPDGRLRCYACGHRCLIPPGQRGICKVRYNQDGRLRVPWGYVAGLQLDPIEKKPFFHAYPGAKALSFGMLGCDLHCSYCFVLDTPILTSTGNRPIGDIFCAADHPLAIPGGEVRFPRGVKVLTASGDVRPVIKAFRHRYQGSLTVVQPEGLAAVRCTPDHRWLATTDATADVWDEIAAGALTPQHFVRVRRGPFDRAVLPVKSVRREPFAGDVYNLEVEGEHSYTAGFCVVKNCQNALTSQALRDPAMGVAPQEVTPQQVVDLAFRHRARVLTSTYNEPLITSEWGVEIFKAGRARGLVCSYVSNGNATAEVLDYIRPYVDLYKVDLKSFDDRHYRQLGGVLKTILDGIRMIHARGFWLEIVTLTIPGFNDSDAELRDIAQFLVSLSPDIPWHVTAFHPDYKMTDRGGTPVQTLLRAAEIGLAAGLRYVYAGNLPGRVGPFEHTHCPTCQQPAIRRVGYTILEYALGPGGRCRACGTAIPGRWD
ncbi:MAG TPA: radical SAM protein [Methylomirabilota bacterium]|jgi:pyruvate formate lyase activating enzyme|nr:radical SAM protein [Methylomirabilota bacterium]